MALVRVAIYGCGQFANRTHIPNLMKFDDVEIVAICDSNAKQLKSTAEAFNISQTYQDGHELLDNYIISTMFFSICHDKPSTDSAPLSKSSMSLIPTPGP